MLPSPRRPTVYVAGPDVFYPNATEVAQKAKDLGLRMGLDIRTPMDNEINRNQSPREVSAEIFIKNKKLIDSCDFVVANLNPFRGAEPDSGTVWEIGYAIGRGLSVVAFTSKPDDMISRVQKHFGIDPSINTRDREGNTIEDFGSPVNLMIAESIKELVIGDLEAAMKAVKRNLSIGATKNQKPVQLKTMAF